MEINGDLLINVRQAKDDAEIQRDGQFIYYIIS